MLKVSGKLSDLFRVNGKSISDYIVGADYKVLCSSLVDMPITKEGKPIGVIDSINILKDEWHGKLFLNNVAEINIENKQSCSIELMDMIRQ